MANSYSPEFDRFWAIYPKGRRVGKLAAWREWQRQVKPLLAEDVIDALARQVTGGHFPDEDRFIPLPTTWLHQGRWEDEITRKPRKAGHATPERGKYEGVY